MNSFEINKIITAVIITILIIVVINKASDFIFNVKATDGKTVINADNLDFLANEDFATIYNNVVLLNDRISLKADKVHYDFQKKYYKISMFNEENVKVKLIQ